MRKIVLFLAIVATPLSGCMQDPATRGLAGAVVGAAVADATNGSALNGAVIGGLAGAASCTIPGTLGC